MTILTAGLASSEVAGLAWQVCKRNKYTLGERIIRMLIDPILHCLCESEGRRFLE